MQVEDISKQLIRLVFGSGTLLLLFFIPMVAHADENLDVTHVATGNDIEQGNPIHSLDISQDGRIQTYVAMREGAWFPQDLFSQNEVKYSNNFGREFKTISSSWSEDANNTAATISKDGTKFLIGWEDKTTNQNKLSLSTDEGVTWGEMDSPSIHPWTSLQISNDGKKIAGLVFNNATSDSASYEFTIYTSIDGGANWTKGGTQIATSIFTHFTNLISSSNGSKIVWNVNGKELLISSDSGVTWSSTGLVVESVGMSPNGQHIMAGHSYFFNGDHTVHINTLYKSDNGGLSFTNQDFNQYIRPTGNFQNAQAISDDGTFRLVQTNDPAVGIGHLFYSTDSGVHYYELFPKSDEFLDGTNFPSAVGQGLSLSSYGNYVLINAYGSFLLGNLFVPPQVNSLNAVASNGAATLSWELPVSSTPLKDFIVQYSSEANPNWTTFSHAASSTATSTTVTGLTNGVAYAFRLSWQNSWGYGSFKETSSEITPGNLPWGPQNVSYSVGDGFFTVNWDGPYWDGDSPIRSYRLYYGTNTTGPWTQVGGSILGGPITVSNLTNGVKYYYRLQAVNDVGGSGYITNIRNPAIPITISSAPGSPSATYSGSNILLSWQSPISNGGSSITNYLIEYSSNNGSSWSTYSHSASASTSITVTGLTTGYSYIFRISAINGAGTGTASNLTTSTGVLVPSVPTGLTATSGDGTASLNWTVPDNGGAIISNYLIEYSSNNGVSWTNVSRITSPDNFETVTGLTNGNTYIFRVSAINSIGTGNTSSASSPIIPSGLPNTPTSVVATASDHSISVSWTAPSNNGSALTDYSIEYSTDAGANWVAYSHSASTSTSVSISGLTNYLSYIFRISAINANGTGSSSNSSAAVNPGSTVSAIAISTNASGGKSGQAFSTQPVVRLKDSSNQTITTDNSTVVTASVSAGGTLIGTKQATASAGLATFSNLGLSGVNGTSYTITFSAAGYSTTQTIAANTGDAYKLVLTTAGIGGSAGVSFTTQPVVKIEDVANNVITTDSSSTITISTATDLCYVANATKTAASGIAQFSSFTMTGTAGTNCVLTYSLAGVLSANQNVTLTPGPAFYLTQTQAGSGGTLGRALTTQPIFKITDSGGNTITSDNSTVVTISVPTQGSATITNGTATASHGIVTFSGLSFANVNLGYLQYQATYSGLISPTIVSTTILKGDPVLSWSNQSAYVGGSAFTITAPTANTTGSFTYSSATTSVATISGSTVTPGVAGTSVITATFTPTDTSKFNSGVTVTMTITIIQTYNLTSTADSHSSITASASIVSGGSKTFSFNTSTGYEITGISIDSNALTGTELSDAISASSYTFSNVTAIHSISLTSTIKSFIVKALGSANGTISNSGDNSVNYGSNSPTFTISANSGYQVSSVTIDGTLLTSGTSPTPTSVLSSGYRFNTVTDSHEIDVVFVRIGVQTYAINTSHDAHTSITASTTVESGSNLKISFASAAGYSLTGVIVDSTPLSGTTLTSALNSGYVNLSNVTGVHSVSVTSTIRTYNIVASADTFGSISSVGTNTVNYGSASPTFTFTPNSGYQVKAVIVDGRSLSNSTNPTLASAKTNGYQFLSIASGHTISVTFELAPVVVQNVGSGAQSLIPLGGKESNDESAKPTQPIAPNKPGSPGSTTSSAEGSTPKNVKSVAWYLKLNGKNISMAATVGKVVQLNFGSIGSEDTLVRVVLKDPKSVTNLLDSVIVKKESGFKSSPIKFSKPGTYRITVIAGKTKKIATVSVYKSTPINGTNT